MQEFYNIKQVKARKQYECQLCRASILPGREYVLEKMKIDGEFYTLRRHIHCDAILQVYIDKYCYEDCYDDEDVSDTIRREVCWKICGNDQEDECSMIPSRPYSCEICLKKMLNPSVLGAAVQSVLDNRED